MNLRLRREVEVQQAGAAGATGAAEPPFRPAAQHLDAETARPRRSSRKRRRGRAAEPAQAVTPALAADLELPEVEIEAADSAPEVEAAAPAPVEIEVEIEMAPAAPVEIEAPADLAVEAEAGESSFESEAVIVVRLSDDGQATIDSDPEIEPADAEPDSTGIEVLVAPETPVGASSWVLEDDARVVDGPAARSAAAPDPEAGETLGAYLRRFRLARRISLDEVSASTRIPVRSLNLLESDDFAALPAEVFVKGFIRCYTRAVGLDLRVAMGLYEGSRQAAPGIETPVAPAPDEASRRKVSLALVTLIVVILATLTLSILFARPRSSHLERADLQSPPPAAAPTSADRSTV